MKTHTTDYGEQVTQPIGDIFSAGSDIWDLAAREQLRTDAVWNLLGESSKGMSLHINRQVVIGTSGTGMTKSVLKPLMDEIAKLTDRKTPRPLLPAQSEVRKAVWIATGQPRKGMSLSAPKSASRVIGVRVR